MTTSINHPWAISDKFRKRYGTTWSEIDFVFHSKISKENFKTEPMATSIGNLQIAGQELNMRYRDLLSYAKSLDVLSMNLYSERVSKTETFEVNIKGRNFMLNCQEIARVAETVAEASTSALRAYEVGLYL
jgi:hypothetical protein